MNIQHSNPLNTENIILPFNMDIGYIEQNTASIEDASVKQTKITEEINPKEKQQKRNKNYYEKNKSLILEKRKEKNNEFQKEFNTLKKRYEEEKKKNEFMKKKFNYLLEIINEIEIELM
jgi:hypothetical protein